MQEPQRNVLLSNAANVVSILGMLPLCILFCECGYQYLVPLIVYNNIMDDLDGVLAGKLGILTTYIRRELLGREWEPKAESQSQ